MSADNFDIAKRYHSKAAKATGFSQIEVERVMDVYWECVKERLLSFEHNAVRIYNLFTIEYKPRKAKGLRLLLYKKRSINNKERTRQIIENIENRLLKDGNTLSAYTKNQRKQKEDTGRCLKLSEERGWVYERYGV